ncbi:MAG: NAD/NADP octopine/nopaline dehydrogenase family protein [Alphaproteobacteria bacterium]|nr:NAD/NADP octopine/nopaline dehydrogenase family protein [Alphaproteobacteria bacterium]
MKISVIGGGHGCHAAAADLAEQGHRISLWRRDGQALAAIKAAGGIRLIDSTGEGHIPLHCITTDIGQALDDTELILSPLPATAQDAVAGAMAPHLTDGQVIFIPPGTLGAVTMSRIVRRAGNRAELAYVEAGTLPYLARMRSDDAVAISARTTRLPSGVYPARLSEHALAIASAAFPAIEPLSDVLDAALMNAGPIIHPPLILMNAGPMQHFDRWDIHNEGTQPAIRAVTDALDGERIAIREALGYGAPHFPLADHYDDSRPEWMYGNAAHEMLMDSGDWREHIELLRHRYMREDVALGLALLVSIAAWAGVPCPVATGLLAMGSAICGEDFRLGPRTWETLGLAGYSAADLQTMLREGETP